MRAIDDLVIRGPAPETAEFLRGIEARLSDGWRRDRELEARLHAIRLDDDESTYCFRCDDAPDRPAAALWMQARGGGEWHVSNIVPLGRHTLSDAEYNRLLAEFRQRFLGPQGFLDPVRAEILPATIRLEDDLSAESARLLKVFSAGANRERLQPADRLRWRHFLLQSHRDESRLDSARLEEWLASEGWPEPARAERAREYERARELLWSYDRERQN